MASPPDTRCTRRHGSDERRILSNHHSCRGGPLCPPPVVPGRRRGRAYRGGRTQGSAPTEDGMKRTRARKAVWGGRFKKGPADSLRAIGDSLHFDKRLVQFDIQASIAHARMLGKQRIIPKRDAAAIVRELGRMAREIERGALRVEGDDEDVHTWIERVLTERIGDAGKKVHTARSRNDQVVTALLLWVRYASQQVSCDCEALLDALTAKAREV